MSTARVGDRQPERVRTLCRGILVPVSEEVWRSIRAWLEAKAVNVKAARKRAWLKKSHKRA